MVTNMKKILCIIASLLLSAAFTVNCSAEYVSDELDNVYDRGIRTDSNGEPYMVDYQFSFDNEIDFSSYTTTRYAPWWVNYHLTSPEQIAQGIHGGESGQCTYTVAISPSSPDIMLGGTDCSGIYRSEDGGKNWRMSSDGFTSAGTSSIAFDPNNSDIAFVVASPSINSESSMSSPIMGIWKSTDSGRSWRQVLSAKSRRMRQQQLFAFGSDGEIWAGLYEGLYKSVDGGETWYEAGLEGQIHDLEYAGGKLYIAIADKGLFMSSDGGNTFEDIGYDLDAPEVYSVRSQPNNPNHIVCCTRNYLYNSYDGGRSFEKTFFVENIKEYASKTRFTRIEFGAPDEEGKCRLYVMMEQNMFPLKWSTDDGKTLHEFKFTGFYKGFTIDKTETGWYSYGFTPHPTEPLTVYYGCEHKSIDGGETYFPNSSGFSGIRPLNFYFDENNPNFLMIAAIDMGLFITKDCGQDQPWLPMGNTMLRSVGGNNTGRTTNSAAIDPKNPQRILANISAKGEKGGYAIKESLDGGVSFHQIEGTDGQKSGMLMQFNKNNPDIIYAGDFLSYDDGKTWIPSPYRLYATAFSDNDIVYGLEWPSQDIYRSDDEGRNWKLYHKAVSSGTQQITVDRENPDKLYIGTYQSGLYIVEQSNVKHLGEESGFIKCAGCGKVVIHHVAQDPADALHLVAGGVDPGSSGSPGLFESYDGGESWSLVPDMPGIHDIWRVAFHPTRKQVFVSTSNGTLVYEFDKVFDRSSSYFNDTENSKVSDIINNLAEKGIISGYADGSFRPTEAITRAETAMLLYSSFDFSQKSDTAFSDVDNNHYACKAIKSLAASGIICGYNSEFRPDDNITAEEMIIIAARMLSYGKKLYIPSDSEMAVESGFSAYARSAAAKCRKYEIIKNNDIFDFSAESYMTREQFALILDRLLNI